MQRPLSCSLQHLTFINLKRAPFALQNESFCSPKRVLLQSKTSPFERQNESFFLAHPKQAHPERIPNASRTHPEGKQFPPERKIISSRENKNPFPRPIPYYIRKSQKCSTFEKRRLKIWRNEIKFVHSLTKPK